MKIKDKEDNISIFSPTLKEKKPVIETENSVKVGSAKITTISTIEKLGLELEGNRRGFKWYKMPDVKLLHLKYSKFYELMKLSGMELNQAILRLLKKMALMDLDLLHLTKEF